MKTLILSAYLVLLTSGYALCQVTVTFKVSGATSFTVPVPNGLSSVGYSIDLKKPHGQVVSDGTIYIYAKPASGDAIRIATGDRLYLGIGTLEGRTITLASLTFLVSRPISSITCQVKCMPNLKRIVLGELTKAPT